MRGISKNVDRRYKTSIHHAHLSLDEAGMVAMSDYCDVFHHYNRE